MRWVISKCSVTRKAENLTRDRDAAEEDEAGASTAVRSQAEPGNECIASKSPSEFAQFLQSADRRTQACRCKL